jgi:hypothetical protein
MLCQHILPAHLQYSTATADAHGQYRAEIFGRSHTTAIPGGVLWPCDNIHSKLVLASSLLLQVPKALAQLCVHALQRHPHSDVPGLAILALDALLYAASFAPGTSLAGATLKQLQDAGLLQHLPALMTHVAQDLAAATAAPVLDSGNSNSGSGKSTAAAASAGTMPNRQNLDAQRVLAIRTASHLLSISLCVTFYVSAAEGVAPCLQHAAAVVQQLWLCSSCSSRQ